ncbi:MAG: molybdate ABC transporter substrate-binding protein [Acidimicrobiia bacterium]
MSNPSLFGWLAVVVGVTLFGTACGDDNSGNAAESTSTSAEATTTTAPKLTGNITVLAAASLTESFTEIGKAFETANPGTKVTFSFGASSALATQANEGAPADLFASADEANMKKVTDTGNATEPTTFTRNRLSILVGKGNPKGIAALADLAKSGVTFVLCAVEVPCGKFGQQALDKAGVKARPKSLEENVKAVVTKVTLGEADAGLVYVTDAKAAGDKAQGVDIPDEQNVIAVYPIGALKQSAAPDVAAAFKAFVLSAAGQQILATYGFLPAA